MLEQVKRFLGLTDGSQDELLSQIIDTATTRLKNRLKGAEIPAEFEYIIGEVSVSRYNRISSEGTAAHSQDGVSYTWVGDDFAPYQSEIDNWLESQKPKPKVRFI